MRNLKTLVKVVQKIVMMNVNTVMGVKRPTKSLYQRRKMNHLEMPFHHIQVKLIFLFASYLMDHYKKKLIVEPLYFLCSKYNFQTSKI